jgi:hypothetical protein
MTEMTTFLRRNAWLGFIGGVVSLYLAAVGIVLAFAERNVIVFSDDGLALTLGRVMLALPPIGVGYFAARRAERGVGSRLVAGLVAGFLTGLIQGAGLLIASALSPEIRDVLIRITPELISFVSFGQDPVVGAVLSVAICSALGLAAAALEVTRSAVRRPIIGGFLAVGILSLAEPFVRPRLQDMDLPESPISCTKEGLTVVRHSRSWREGLIASRGGHRERDQPAHRASDPGQRG